jgi:hypothetical protein
MHYFIENWIKKKLVGKCTMTDFVDIFDELINEQNDKIKCALIGIGDITVKKEYKHVFVDPIHFAKLNSIQKEKYLKLLVNFNPVNYKKLLECKEINLELPG